MASQYGEDRRETGDDGAFQFEDVADGSYEVLLSEAGYRLVRARGGKVTAGQARTRGDLVAGRRPSVTGARGGGAGQPVAKASVQGFLPPSMVDMRANMDRALRPSVLSDEQGHFELGGFDAGKVRVHAEATGFLPGKVDVSAGDSGVVLALDRSCDVS